MGVTQRGEQHEMISMLKFGSMQFSSENLVALQLGKCTVGGEDSGWQGVQKQLGECQHRNGNYVRKV